MAKIVLNPITTGYRSLQQYNADLALITAAIENTLSRDGSLPNSMEDVLDMNSFEIINLPLPVNPTDVVRLQDLQAYIQAFAELEVSGQVGQIVSTPAYFLLTGFDYGFQTSISGLSAYLPPLSSVKLGSTLTLSDDSYNANINPVTIHSYNTDQILLYGNSTTSISLNVADFVCKVRATSTGWRVIVYTTQ